MNKKGFTLIEILSTIILIGLLLGIAVPGVNRIRNNMNKKALNTKIELIEQAAVLWGQDNRTRLTANSCNIDGTNYSCNKVSIKTLVDDDYLDGDNNNKVVENPTNKVDLYTKNCVVSVYKKNNRVYAKYVSDGQNTVCKIN